jgi:predicted DNA-binding protein
MKIIIQQYKAGMRRIQDALEHVDKLNNDYLRSDSVVCKFAVEQYLKELEDEMFRIRKENSR